MRSSSEVIRACLGTVTKVTEKGTSTFIYIPNASSCGNVFKIARVIMNLFCFEVLSDYMVDIMDQIGLPKMWEYDTWHIKHMWCSSMCCLVEEFIGYTRMGMNWWEDWEGRNLDFSTINTNLRRARISRGSCALVSRPCGSCFAYGEFISWEAYEIYYVVENTITGRISSISVCRGSLKHWRQQQSIFLICTTSQALWDFSVAFVVVCCFLSLI